MEDMGQLRKHLEHATIEHNKMASHKGTILVTGGTGKVSSRLVPLLSAHGNSVIVASRSGSPPQLVGTAGVKFDWFDPESYTFLSDLEIVAIFIVVPPVIDCLPPVKPFLDLAVRAGVTRFVLLGASLLETGDGPMMSQVAKYIVNMGVEYTILRPTWFMENFSEMEHQRTIRDQGLIMTAAGDGRVPFVSAEDIAAVAFRALTDKEGHNTDHLILSHDLLSYDEVAAILTKKFGREISHKRISEDELAVAMEVDGVPADYSRVLAQLDTAIRNGEEDRMNHVVEEVTGRKPKGFEEFVDDCVRRGVWEKM